MAKMEVAGGLPQWYVHSPFMRSTLASFVLGRAGRHAERDDGCGQLTSGGVEPRAPPGTLAPARRWSIWDGEFWAHCESSLSVVSEILRMLEPLCTGMLLAHASRSNTIGSLEPRPQVGGGCKRTWTPCSSAHDEARRKEIRAAPEWPLVDGEDRGRGDTSQMGCKCNLGTNVAVAENLPVADSNLALPRGCQRCRRPGDGKCSPRIQYAPSLSRANASWKPRVAYMHPARSDDHDGRDGRELT
ncbi:hypothetical protein LXA43DRAFT_327106 [Ganoderma leucocontextum]|nr:hypothetical protein LXA43DRAFT_327106 [Ganoderma leucocontextum]